MKNTAQPKEKKAMARNRIHKRSKKTGLPPGTLVHIGEKKLEKVKITLIDYNEQRLEEREVQTIEECFPFRDSATVSWINIDGLHEVEIIEKLGTHFGLHPLIMEDILNTTQRPKMEDFGEYIFLVLKVFGHEEGDYDEKMEQISLVFGPNFVLSFQEKEGPLFNPVKERLRKGKGRLRKSGADYLAYSLIDCIVDGYFAILEKIGEKIEFLEEELVGAPGPKTLNHIHKLKREMIFLRKSVWPLREVVSGMERGESTLIRKPTRIFLRDVYDHTIQVIDTVETYRDMLSGMLDMYLSSLSNRMNEVIKVLTIIATIFIPLTFIAGIYGMNFEHMPELKWRWGYLVVWAIMISLGTLMVVLFKRKKWI